MANTFSAVIEGWTRRVKEAEEAVFKEAAQELVKQLNDQITPDLCNEWSEFSGIALLSDGVAAKRKDDGVPMTGDDSALHEVEQMIELICSINDVLDSNPLLMGPLIQVRSGAFRTRVGDQFLGRNADRLGTNGSHHSDLLVRPEHTDRFGCDLHNELWTSEPPHRLSRGQITRSIQRMTPVRIANVHMHGLCASGLARERVRRECVGCQRQIWMFSMAFARAVRRDHNCQIGHAGPTLR